MTLHEILSSIHGLATLVMGFGVLCLASAFDQELKRQNAINKTNVKLLDEMLEAIEKLESKK